MGCSMKKAFLCLLIAVGCKTTGDSGYRYKSGCTVDDQFTLLSRSWGLDGNLLEGLRKAYDESTLKRSINDPGDWLGVSFVPGADNKFVMTRTPNLDMLMKGLVVNTDPDAKSLTIVADGSLRPKKIEQLAKGSDVAYHRVESELRSLLLSENLKSADSIDKDATYLVGPIIKDSDDITILDLNDLSKFEVDDLDLYGFARFNTDFFKVVEFSKMENFFGEISKLAKVFDEGQSKKSILTTLKNFYNFNNFEDIITLDKYTPESWMLINQYVDDSGQKYISHLRVPQDPEFVQPADVFAEILIKQGTNSIIKGFGDKYPGQYEVLKTFVWRQSDETLRAYDNYKTALKTEFSKEPFTKPVNGRDLSRLLDDLSARPTNPRLPRRPDAPTPLEPAMMSRKMQAILVCGLIMAAASAPGGILLSVLAP